MCPNQVKDHVADKYIDSISLNVRAAAGISTVQGIVHRLSKGDILFHRVRSRSVPVADRFKLIDQKNERELFSFSISIMVSQCFKIPFSSILSK